MLRNQGRERGKKYEHDAIGFNHRMSEIAAAIGREELKKLPEWISKRRELASAYMKQLDGVVRNPVEKGYAKAVYYVYTIMSEARDNLREHLEHAGIESGIYYPVPIHLQPAYKDYGYGSLPVAEDVSAKVLSLPIHPYLKPGDIGFIAGKVKEFQESAKNK